MRSSRFPVFTFLSKNIRIECFRFRFRAPPPVFELHSGPTRVEHNRVDVCARFPRDAEYVFIRRNDQLLRKRNSQTVSIVVIHTPVYFNEPFPVHSFETGATRTCSKFIRLFPPLFPPPPPPPHFQHFQVSTRCRFLTYVHGSIREYFHEIFSRLFTRGIFIRTGCRTNEAKLKRFSRESLPSSLLFKG